MKNTLLLHILLFLFVPINLYSQKKLSEFPVKIPKPDEVYILSDSLGYMACVFQNTKEYEVDFLDPNYKVIGTAITQKVRGDRNQKILGGVLNKEYCYAYFYNEKIKAFSILEVKRSSGEAAYSRIQIANKDEQFLRAFEMEGKFYIVIVPRLTNTIRLIIMNGKNMEEKNFNAEMPAFYTALSKQNDKLNVPAESEIGIEDIDYRLENNIKSTFPSKKMYHYDGKIYLTFDEPNLTHLITLDPASGISNYKKLNFSLDKGNNSGQKQGNSYMLRNRFFRTTMSHDQLNISVLDLDSMKLLATYNFYPGEEITIQNGPLIQEGGTGYLMEEKEIKKTEQFFRKALSGNLAIAVNETDSATYQMEVGSYEMITTYRHGPGSGFGSPSISIGVGMGMGFGMGPGFGVPMGFGSPYYPGYYSNQPQNREKLVYFKSKLSKDNLIHQEGAPEISINYKINEYEYRVFRSNFPEVLAISPYKKSILLGYYIKNGKRFELVEFNP